MEELNKSKSKNEILIDLFEGLFGYGKDREFRDTEEVEETILSYEKSIKGMYDIYNEPEWLEKEKLNIMEQIKDLETATNILKEKLRKFKSEELRINKN